MGCASLIYRFGISELLVFVNITDKSQCVKINMALNNDYTKVLSLSVSGCKNRTHRRDRGGTPQYLIEHGAIQAVGFRHVGGL